MRSSLRLTFAVMMMCCASAWSLSLRRDQGPQATTPDQNSQEQSQPPVNPPAEPVPPAVNNPAVTTTTPEQKAGPPPKPPVLKHRKHKVHHSSSAHEKTSTPNTNGDAGKVVVRNGGAKEGSAQLTPAVNPAQAKTQLANTASLLAATDANLKRVAGRQLTPAQQSMINEINTYMQQAKAAAASADTNRAQTLAYKAHLLSNELAHK
jgi:hypothetical protein